MLVLSRKRGQRIRIGDKIVITVFRARGGQMKIGIDAPRDLKIVRDELPPLTEAQENNEITLPISA